MEPSIIGLSELNQSTSPTIVQQTNEGEQPTFSHILKSSLDRVNETQLKSEVKTNALVNGEIEDLHEVMVTAQKAAITLETTVQIQRKVIDAYNEVMRMQI